MKLFQPLARSASKSERRYSFSDYISWLNLTGAAGSFPVGLQTTQGGDKAEPIGSDFTGYVQGALKSNGIVSAVELVRVLVFSEARFQFQALRNGRPGDLFANASLGMLERPWPGGTTGDLLARMILDADMAGNFYGTVLDGEIVRLRPDWVEIILEARTADRGLESGAVTVGARRAGYMYWEGGKQAGGKPALFLPNEVAHFAPYPDPMATYRGMSWLTPVVREVMADTSATKHKLKFFENAATPNLAVSLKDTVTPEQFEKFVDKMDEQHKSVENAYKTLYTAGGADVTVIGADMKQLDFKATQGAGETRIAAAAGVHPVIVGLSEGMAGSSLNAGNFGAARRRFADGTMRPLWRNAAGSLETLVRPPASARLWYDDRDIGFLREDAMDSAQILKEKLLGIESAIRGGYKPDSAVAAVAADDITLLEHTGLYSVQLQPPGADTPARSMTVTDQELAAKLLAEGWTRTDTA